MDWTLKAVISKKARPLKMDWAMKGVKSENVRPPPTLPPCEVEGRGASLDNKLSRTYLQGFVTLGVYMF